MDSASGSLSSQDELGLALPTLLYAEFMTYSDGSYDMLGDSLGVAPPVVLNTSWTGQTKSTYTMTGDSLAVISPVCVAAGWVQYGTVHYNRFVLDELVLNSPSVVTTTWT